MRPAVLFALVLFGQFLDAAEVQTASIYPVSLVREIYELGVQTCKILGGRGGIKIEIENCAVRVQLASITEPVSTFPDTSESDLSPQLVFALIGGSVLAQATGPWTTTVKTTPQFNFGSPLKNERFRDHLSVLVLNNGRLLRHVCQQVTWPPPGCGDREEALLHVEKAGFITHAQIMYAPSFLQFVAYPSDEAASEIGNPIFRLLANSREIETIKTDCKVRTEDETAEIWPPPNNNTERWAPLALSCIVDVEIPYCDGCTMLEVVGLWLHPEDTFQVLARDSLILTKSPRGWHLPTDSTLATKAEIPPPKYLYEAQSLENLMVSHAAFVANQKPEAALMYEPRHEAGWGNRVLSIVGAYLTAMLNGRALVFYYCEPVPLFRYFDLKPSRGARWHGRGQSRLRCGDEPRPLWYGPKEIYDISAWEVPNVTAARFRMIERLLPLELRNNLGLFGLVFEGLFEHTAHFSGKIAEAQKNMPRMDVSIQLRVGGDEKNGVGSLTSYLHPKHLLICGECALAATKVGSNIFISADCASTSKYMEQYLSPESSGRNLYQHCTNAVSTAGRLDQFSLLCGRTDFNRAENGSIRTEAHLDSVMVDWYLLGEADNVFITSDSTFGFSAAGRGMAAGYRLGEVNRARIPVVFRWDYIDWEKEYGSLDQCDFRNISKEETSDYYLRPCSFPTLDQNKI